MKKFRYKLTVLLFSSLVFSISTFAGENSFIIKVNTTLGSAASNSYTIPAYGTDLNYSVVLPTSLICLKGLMQKVLLMEI